MAKLAIGSTFERISFDNDVVMETFTVTVTLSENVDDVYMTNNSLVVEEPLVYKTVVEGLLLYYAPLLIILGTLGNLTCAVIFLTTPKLRRVSCTIYIAAIATLHAGYMTGYTFIWLRHLAVNIYGRPGWCQMVTLLTGSSNMATRWLVLCLAFDRYFSLRKRNASIRLCCTFYSKLCVIIVSCMSISVYLNKSLTIHSINVPTRGPMCIPFHAMAHTLKIVDRVEALVNGVLPMSGVFIFCVLTCKSMLDIKRLRRAVIAVNSLERSPLKLPSRLEYKLTRTSMTICWVYLLLSVPSEANRLAVALREAFGGPLVTPDNSTQQLLLLVTCTSSVVNVFIYTITFSAFRRAFTALCIGCEHRMRKRLHKRDNGLKSLVNATVLIMANQRPTEDAPTDV